MMRTLQIRTSKQEEFIEITKDIAEICKKENWIEGTVHLFVQHTTCGLTINENADLNVQIDFLRRFSIVLPVYDKLDRHGEGNSAAHVKSSLLGFSVVIPIIGGELALGRWQGIYLVEFDGARTRNILVQGYSY